MCNRNITCQVGVTYGSDFTFILFKNCGLSDYVLCTCDNHPHKVVSGVVCPYVVLMEFKFF